MAFLVIIFIGKILIALSLKAFEHVWTSLVREKGQRVDFEILSFGILKQPLVFLDNQPLRKIPKMKENSH